MDENIKEDEVSLDTEAINKEVEIKALQEKVSEMEGNWKRALADYKNLVDRTNKEKKQFIEFANEILILKLLAVYDSLEMLGKYSSDQGLQLTIKQFEQVLKEEGLKEIEALGRIFDTQEMEGIEMVAGEKDKVTEVLTKGFYFKEKILRPARVKVGNGS
jgi:molecular chaperone GrpE